ncbi:hypothetical protein HDU98_007240 [Podochytrium sp. JEL0797]|nr:hypothetical protein HDU98_007240 [Podochytrium sp. JEL0797]
MPYATFLKVDVDKLKDIAGTWGVRAMPTFMLFKAGKKVEEVVGADLGKLESLINEHAPAAGEGHTLGSSSSGPSAAYVNPWKDRVPTQPSAQSAPAPAVTATTVSEPLRKSLVEMGFASTRAVLALTATKNGGVQAAIEWLFANPDESFVADAEMKDSDELQRDAMGGGSSTELGNDDAIHETAAAEFHAVKSGHQSFSESSQVIQPLSADEKKAKLEQLKLKVAQKKEEKRLKEIEENKANEKVRRTSGKEMIEIKEKMMELELKKVAEQKKREKEEDRIFKAKIKAQIELDRKDRAAKLEKEKLERQGLGSTPILSTASSSESIASDSGPKEYTEARIQIRLVGGAILTHTFPASDPLSVVYAFVSQNSGARAGSFKLATTFPRQVLNDQTKTLKELGLVPSAVLAVV